MIRKLLLLFLLMVPAGMVFSQKQPAYDHNYIADKTDDFLLRVYGSNKFTRLTIGDYHYKERLVYKPNSNYNVGVGFNYRWLGVNLGFRTPLINDDNDRLGKTKYFDLQAYMYLRKLTIDFYGQDYEGYYLANDGLVSSEPVNNAPYFLRSDIQTRNLGANVEYLFNGDRFSYRAIYLQNERQLKSAGSFILGGGLHYHHTRADSSLIPSDIIYANYADNEDYNRSGIASLVVNGGYAHTFIIAKRFFVTGSALAGVGANYADLKNEATNYRNTSVGLQLNGIARLGTGYNGDRYYAGIYFVTNVSASSFSNSGGYQMYQTGLVRVAVARRFNAPRKIARLFDGIEGLFK